MAEVDRDLVSLFEKLSFSANTNTGCVLTADETELLRDVLGAWAAEGD